MKTKTYKTEYRKVPVGLSPELDAAKAAYDKAHGLYWTWDGYDYASIAGPDEDGGAATAASYWKTDAEHAREQALESIAKIGDELGEWRNYLTGLTNNLDIS